MIRNDAFSRRNTLALAQRFFSFIRFDIIRVEPVTFNQQALCARCDVKLP